MDYEPLMLLEKAIEGFNDILIIPHNDPDPDAIASSLGLKHLLKEKYGLQARVAYRGIIGRAENRAMIKYLEHPLEKLQDTDLNQGTPIALVDTQPGSGNNPIPVGTPVAIVIDHHPRVESIKDAKYTDVRTGIGSTSTILTEYLRKAEVELPTSLATALFYGIKTDTMGLARGATVADASAYFFLQPNIDIQALGKIENAQVPPDYFKSFAAALNSAWIYDDVITAYIGEMSYPDLSAEMADIFQKLQGVNWVICMGVYEGELILSVRSRSDQVGAGELVQKIVDGLGSAGGHGTMAAGHISLANDVEPRELSERLTTKALKYLKGNTEISAKPLV